MDPVSAIGVAAGAMQFLDFGLRLLSTSYDIYKSPSGRSAKQVALSTIVDDLTGLLDQVKDTSSAGYAYTSPADDKLLKLSKECKTLIAPLQEALGRLQKDGPTKFTFEEPQVVEEKSVRKTLYAALRLVWKESEIDETIDKLDKMKRRMMTATLFSLWDGSKQSQQREVQFSKRLDEMVLMLRQIDDRLGGTGQEATPDPHGLSQMGFGDEDAHSPGNIIEVLNDTQSPESRRLYDELLSYLWDRQWSPQQPERPNAHMDAAAMASMRATFQASIIESIAFDAIRLRQDAITKAFDQTFSWIFKTGSAEKLGWPSFPAWLEGDVTEPYWITGKPGSGKSTLMNFVLEHRSLSTHLTPWARGLPLLVAGYYAWIAGSSLQKSRLGLMRTLIHQSLLENPSLVSIVAPRRWALLTTLRSVVRMPPWQEWEIDESFETLLSQCSKTVKLALFVDGLDEFESPPMEIIDFIQKLNARSGIKICVASRQWTEFNDAFKGNPMLRMQDLTTAGMTHFVRVKLEGNPGFLELGKVFPRETSNLINEIIKKSSGVFLWVSIVVKALLEALTEGDGLPELQATIDQLPSDIAQLYDTIWASIGGRNISKSSELLTVFNAAYGPLSYLTLWLADKKQSPVFDVNSLPPEATTGIADLMKRRLDSRTRGILEISQNGTVDFLHRTARDWVSKPEVWERISSSVEEHFDPYLLLLKAETIRITDKSNLSKKDLDEFWEFINRSLWYAAHVRDTAESRTKLTRILNMFNNGIDKLIADRYVGLSGWYLQAKGTQVRLHWSSCQSPDSLGNFENTFLGLTAQFCVIPYLRERAASNPDAMKPRASKTCLSLLENAVFGYSGVTDPDGNHDDREFNISRKQRLETIAFLLEHGASPKQEIFSSGGLVIDNVRARKATEKTPAEERYWSKVESLLAPKRQSTMKSIFNFRRGRKS